MDNSLITSTVILITAIGSVFGGMFGAYIITLLGRLRTKTISEYHVNNETNRGDTNEQRGEPMHGKGEPAFLDNKPVWKWTNKPCGIAKDHSLIYGPYSHDLNLPGKYRIEFLIKGKGFRRNNNQMILILDVSGIIIRGLPLYNTDGSPMLDSYMNVQTRGYTESFRIYNSKKIRKCDLADGKWHKFHVYVHSNGSQADLYEYRVREVEDYRLSSDEEVYIDTITVKKIN